MFPACLKNTMMMLEEEKDHLADSHLKNIPYKLKVSVKQCRPRSDCSFRSSLIRSYTVLYSLGLSDCFSNYTDGLC